MRNVTIHKCDLSNICTELEINIELLSTRTDKTESRVEHYHMHPYVEYGERYKAGLANSHHFINDTTTLTSHSLGQCEEIEDLKRL